MELCNPDYRTWQEFKSFDEKMRYWNLDSWRNERPVGVKRRRMVCPICKRRMMSSVKMAHDNDGFIHSIPPHKPKMWWKKHKKTQKKECTSRI